MRNPYVIVVVLVIAAITVWRLAVLKKKPSPAELAAAAARPDAGPPPTASDAPAPAAGPTRATPKANASPERAAADKLRAEIAAARARRLASAPTAPPAPPPGAAGAATPAAEQDGEPGLDKDYIREQVRVVLPLLQECYEQALERSPAAGGKVTVTFTIAGEPELGGAVEASDLVKDKTDVSDPEFTECVTETMFAAQFKPPQGGGSVEVTYPFQFATQPPDAPDGGPPRP